MEIWCAEVNGESGSYKQEKEKDRNRGNHIILIGVNSPECRPQIVLF